MIELKDVVKIYESKNEDTVALKGINLTLPNKGFILVCGKSGSGKSTLLNLVGGLDAPTSGEIIIDDEDITEFNELELDNYHQNDLAFVFQNYSLFKDLTVEENIALALKENKDDLKEEIANILNLVGLKDYQKKLVKNLSGGEKQRVAVARAAIKKTKIILCDEPCGNLDYLSSTSIMKTLKKLSETSLVFMVSHNMSEAYYYADRILTLDEGRIVNDLSYEDDPNFNKFECIDNLVTLSNEEIMDISKKIQDKEIIGICTRKSFFKPFKGYKDLSSNKTKKEKIKFKSFKTTFKLLNKSIGITFLFALILGIILSLDTVCYPLRYFDGGGLH